MGTIELDRVATEESDWEAEFNRDFSVFPPSDLLREAVVEVMTQHPFCEVARSIGRNIVRLTYNSFFKCLVVKSAKFPRETGKTSIPASQAPFRREVVARFVLVARAIPPAFERPVVAVPC